MECNDNNCPTHGSIKVRGSVLEGTIVSDKMKNSVIIERKHLKKIPKYKRYVRMSSRLPAHKPACVKATIGDRVEVSETKKISKTKSFVITKVMEEKK